MYNLIRAQKHKEVYYFRLYNATKTRYLARLQHVIVGALLLL